MKRIYQDYHMHSSISPDSNVPIEEMCQAALDKGFREIAITDHFEFYSKGVIEYRFNEAYLEEYSKTIKACIEKFDGRLIIKKGIELGQQHLQLEMSNRILQSYKFDFVLGSVHKINKLDLSQIKYNYSIIDIYCKRYLEQVYELVDKGDFDSLAHLDLIKRYASQLNVEVNLIDYRIELAQIFERLIERNKGLEINTSSLRQGLDEPFPTVPILKMYKSMGGEIITIGSDAHNPFDIGRDFDRVISILEEIGFRNIYTFDNRKSQRIELF
ncbi:histidinol-phosphatase HisJ family protein [Vallitalea sp.]|jgi:histidinol-phosphatase (PHP family)|uniref:histidinol-phosphatase HisJ family protein n=1 Tax=Vallitalea sp. TaxID=1882829 RepID=UPI0025D34EF3|nr:histidinol-phosphatase HisJ family protein [Vallitalea sp.]MCT4688805.1 histidinol-phosphatase HisJ family protein [Vallitalea sp.]